MALDRYGAIFRKVHPQLQDWHNELVRVEKDLYAKIGSQPPQKVDSISPQSPAQPPPVVLNVGAIAGVGFNIQIVRPQDIQPASMKLRRAQILRGPNAPLTPLYHNLNSATDTNFNAASNLTDYGISQQSSWPIPANGVTYYWRIRSSFDGKNWNPWQIFSGPSGPIAVTV